MLNSDMSIPPGVRGLVPPLPGRSQGARQGCQLESLPSQSVRKTQATSHDPMGKHGIYFSGETKQCWGNYLHIYLFRISLENSLLLFRNPSNLPAKIPTTMGVLSETGEIIIGIKKHIHTQKRTCKGKINKTTSGN